MRLFDSVASVGIFVDRRFLCTSSTSNARHVRHAVSIHEREKIKIQTEFV
ncbi:uncharacterized protein C5L36_0A13040 [Pichia kudriavzevii]|uniref:Uncharacterized protein n=1 Tax=Pichia kudriavzevii TaxID=4909 RepID=A0A2U9R0N2_PICKU|nr:uncharacterized protein C5L36_0A13040 [Pichia kudriavzevii]AWU74729.1 hypothetical protein C5L36_0A13040 [Pichia kudriavzevii]